MQDNTEAGVAVVERDNQGSCAILRLNRPEALNALNAEVLHALGEAIDAVAKDEAVRALIVTGAGPKAFCAGADIKEFIAQSPIAMKERAELGQSTFARLGRLRVPSIAAINGFAFGGGFELALACTFRVALASAKMGLPEVKLGLLPGFGGTQRLPRLIGEARALELIMSGRFIDAAEAEKFGLVNRVASDDVVAAALAFASEFTGFSLSSQSLARAAVERGASVALDEGLRIEAELFGLVSSTQDAAEGCAAFVEKRAAVFKDR
ncbi:MULTISPECIES: enoyl-CoA hydratase-related protein [unclassified Chelatococcus]|uniref:enoyl-CoA hydratase/isomerase family protein n=1 Tax=unclassified Chelatococcus TaxID=2638111 RepID=UPI001BCF950C|nr:MULTISPECIES: enoyl-CoA hydratase-related protein [unclassified Chelatococcus]MBS7695910.1 enoyl-CoA hydratase/isomerase family protein [Chelatococcus sp. YT9]MBX3555715.1 enoyl-CoA hydratase/isomerase family protein [Chelatococcus sp.]